MITKMKIAFMLYRCNIILCNPAISLQFLLELTTLVCDTGEMPYTMVETNNIIASPTIYLIYHLKFRSIL